MKDVTVHAPRDESGPDADRAGDRSRPGTMFLSGSQTKAGAGAPQPYFSTQFEYTLLLGLTCDKS